MESAPLALPPPRLRRHGRPRRPGRDIELVAPEETQDGVGLAREAGSSQPMVTAGL